MKNKNWIFGIFMMALLMQSCMPKDEENEEVSADLLPGVFKIDIPASISSDESLKYSSYKMSQAETDTMLAGDTIYEHLRTFIRVGEDAGTMVQAILGFLKQYNIDKPMSLTYQDDEDNNRTKKLEVIEGASYQGQLYSYKMTVTNLDQVQNDTDDDGKALQVFWSQNPVRGVAILKPYNSNKADNIDYPHVKFMVTYSEQKTLLYDRTMEVAVSGYPAQYRYGLSTLKMFVGQKGDYVDVYGNTNHPLADFYQRLDPDSTAFNWAFAASSVRSSNIGIAEVGLPPSYISSQDRAVLLDDYSVQNTYERILRDVYFDNISDADYNTYVQPNVDRYLQNTQPPGYFTAQGFVQAGTAPDNQYKVIEQRIEDLIPFSPDDVAAMDVAFQ